MFIVGVFAANALFITQFLQDLIFKLGYLHLDNLKLPLTTSVRTVRLEKVDLVQYTWYVHCCLSSSKNDLL